VIATTLEAQAPPVHRIRCGGIWGGITAVDLDVRTQAISASVQSTASGGARGGDIYYLSVCGGDVVTRIALADMRGHGERVSHLSQWLYESLEARINSLDGGGVLADLNGLVYDHGFDALTTAAVVSYYSGDSSLSYSYAGHPPILVRQGCGAWMPRPIEGDSRPANLPLGTLRTVDYDVAKVTLAPGDRVFLYTDGVVECPNAADEFYGDDRLLEVLDRTSGLSLPEVKAAVFDSLVRFAAGAQAEGPLCGATAGAQAEGPLCAATKRELLHDDCTLMVLEVREPSWP
jgi:sigma-B regulation protein RsbU (phosphoserine phosphatase)